MPTLVTGNGNAMHIFFYGTFYNLMHAAVVAQVDDLRTLALQNTPHDIDGGIVAVKQTGGGNNSYFFGNRFVHTGLPGKENIYPAPKLTLVSLFRTA